MIKISNENYKLLKTIPVIDEKENADEPSKIFYEQNKGVGEDGIVYAFPTGAGDELVDSNGDKFLVVEAKLIYGTIE